MTKEGFSNDERSSAATERTPFSLYYFSNLNVMNENPTVPSRKCQGYRLSTPSPEQKVNHFQEAELCIEHGCPIQYLCFTCHQSVLLCSQCISLSNHLQHDIKNIERSKQFLKNQLEEWACRLQCKNNLLNICNDQFRESPAQIFRNAELYKEQLVETFEQLTKRLQQQFKSICDRISQFIQDYKNDCQKQKERIRLRQLQISRMIEINQNKLRLGTAQQQAHYFSQKKQEVESLLDQTEINYYKQQLVEANWGLQPEIVKNLKSNIDKLSLSFKFPEPYREMKEKVKESLKKSVKKSKKDLKLLETIADKHQRASSKARNSNFGVVSPFFSTFTPKNLSKDKKIKLKKSPGEGLLKKRKKSSAKIVSMPASPEKEVEQSLQISPEKSKKNLFKKK